MANPFEIGAVTAAGSGSSRSLAVANATAIGDTLLVCVVVNNTSCTVSAVSDSQGNTYTADPNFTSAQPTLYLYRSPGATGGPGAGATASLSTSDTFTVTTAAVSGNVEIFAVDVPGAGAVDQIATIASGTSTTPSVAVTPTANNEVVVAFFGTANAGGAPTVNSPLTSLGQNQSGSNPFQVAAYEVLVGGSGVAQTVTETIVSANWRAGMYSFNPGSGATTLALPVAQEAINAPVPTALVTKIVNLPVAQVNVAAPAPSFAVAGMSLALPVEQEAIAAYPLGTPGIYFHLGGVKH
jgi:hypothetical protein